MRAIGPRNRRVARTGPAFLCRPSDHHEHALHVLGQQRGAHGNVAPRIVLGHVGADAGAGACQHAAERRKVGHDRSETLDPAADHELLVEHADDAEPGVGFGQDGAKDAVHPLAPLGEVLGARLWLGPLWAHIQRSGLGRHQLIEQVRRRPALWPHRLWRRRRQDDRARILQRRLRQRHQPRRAVARARFGRSDPYA